MLQEKFKINGKLQMAIIYAIALIQDDESKGILLEIQTAARKYEIINTCSCSIS